MRAVRPLAAAVLAVLALPAAAPAADSVSVKGPRSVAKGKAASLRVTGRADALVLLRVRFAAPGRTCARSLPDGAAGTFQRLVHPGRFSHRFRHRFRRKGTWRACAYLSTTGTILARSSARIRVR